MAERTIPQNLALASRAHVFGMPTASGGLWLAVLAPALVVFAIKVSELTTPDTAAGRGQLGRWGRRPGCTAQALPQSLAPAMALPVITLGGYPALFIAGAIVAIIDAVLVTRIQGVT